MHRDQRKSGQHQIARKLADFNLLLFRLSIYPRYIGSRNDGAVDSALLSEWTGLIKKGGSSIRLVSLDTARDG